MKHGAGATIEAAHDQAALMALHSLADLGMEAVADGKKDTNTNLNSGDGCVTFITLYLKFFPPQIDSIVKGRNCAILC